MNFFFEYTFLYKPELLPGKMKIFLKSMLLMLVLAVTGPLQTALATSSMESHRIMGSSESFAEETSPVVEGIVLRLARLLYKRTYEKIIRETNEKAASILEAAQQKATQLEDDAKQRVDELIKLAEKITLEAEEKLKLAEEASLQAEQMQKEAEKQILEMKKAKEEYLREATSYREKRSDLYENRFREQAFRGIGQMNDRLARI